MKYDSEEERKSRQKVKEEVLKTMKAERKKREAEERARGKKRHVGPKNLVLFRN